VKFYKRRFPGVKIVLGGIYASLLPDHAKTSGADDVFVGLYSPAEMEMPDYDIVTDTWDDGSILFASRGCIRKCGFCSVPKLEGPPNALKYSLTGFIHPHHTKVILWDNNILGNANWRTIFDELQTLGLTVDFNQGLDARLVTDEVAERLSHLKMETIRLAYDYHGIGPAVGKAIERLKANGINPRKIVVYTLYNYVDDPEDLYQRIMDLFHWGAISYPMRFEPLCSLQKNKYVGTNWTADNLEKVMRARAVIGYAGTFPPYDPLVRKFERAGCFDEAFRLEPPKIKEKIPVALLNQHREISGRIGRNYRKYGRARNWSENNLEQRLHLPR
jgi:hypothetical protein